MLQRALTVSGGGGGLTKVYDETVNASLNVWYSTGIDVSSTPTIVFCYSTLTIWRDLYIENGTPVINYGQYIEYRINNGILEFSRSYQSGDIRCIVWQ